jgi:hypothetical protein
VERLVGRYDLLEQVTSGKGRTLWRGQDVVLDRPVGVLVLDRDHPHAANVRRAAQAAARVEHPSVLRVVDADTDDGRVLVVTRWLQGSTLSDLLAAGPLPPDEATRICRDVASALAASGAEGVHHLVLDPRDVLVTDQGVAVVGVGVRAALEGVTADDDADQVDAWRVGAVLYAALTARWPGHACAGLPAAPTVAGRVARPRQVRAGVPLEVDEVTWRALQPDADDPLESPAAIAAALTEVNAPTGWTEPPQASRMRWSALGFVVIAALFLAGVLLVAWQFWQDSSREPPTPPTGASSTAASPSPSVTQPVDVPIPVRQVSAFDPAGDEEENDADAEAAIDGDPTTAWRTVTYASRELGELKPGVGLKLRLGGPQAVSGIEVELVGRGSDVEIWAERDAGANPTAQDPLAGYKKLADVPGAGDQFTYRFNPAVSTRSVIVWLTALPADGSGYRGGIAEVLLLS